jgi:hypothetical protein
MIGLSVDVLFAGIVPFFFVAFGVMWLGCVISDLFKKKK